MTHLPDLELLTRKVCELCIGTGEAIRKEVSMLKEADIETKSLNNFVTYVDRQSEERLVEGLSKLLPGSGFIAEENPALQQKEWTWVVDPLDGTTNFIHGVPVYCISVGLMKGKELLAGVIYEVNRKECFYTWAGAPSFLDHKLIRVSRVERLSGSLLATGFPYYDWGLLEPFIHLFKALMQHSHGLRRLGSAAADLAYVACGRFDGFYEYGLSPWDVAAGALLVQNAGGCVSDFNGTGDFIKGKQIIATNSNIYREFLEFFKLHFR